MGVDVSFRHSESIGPGSHGEYVVHKVDSDVMKICQKYVQQPSWNSDQQHRLLFNSDSDVIMKQGSLKNVSDQHKSFVMFNGFFEGERNKSSVFKRGSLFSINDNDVLNRKSSDKMSLFSGAQEYNNRKSNN